MALLDDTSIANLTKLRDYVAANVDKINLEMATFASNSMRSVYGEVQNYPTCGSSCCLVGHAPAVVPVSTDSKYFVGGGFEYVTWSYEVLLNCSEYGEYGDPDDPDDVWNFLFHENWANDPNGAIERLDYVIDTREPPEDWTEQPHPHPSYMVITWHHGANTEGEHD